MDIITTKRELVEAKSAAAYGGGPMIGSHSGVVGGVNGGLAGTISQSNTNRRRQLISIDSNNNKKRLFSELGVGDMVGGPNDPQGNQYAAGAMG